LNMEIKAWLINHLLRRCVKGLRFLLHHTRLLWDKSADSKYPIFGMTTLEEQKLFEECARQVTSLNGITVDLGCWMCSTTISLARGAPQEKVIGIDRFIWENWMDSFLKLVQKDYRPGESFLSEAQRIVKSFNNRIELIQADLTQFQWPGNSIKLLLIDAMKSRELVECIANSFYPYLKQGGILIHQDFMHFLIPWIHILQYRLKDYFQLIHEVKNGGTVTFKVFDTMSSKVISAATNFQTITDNEVDKAFNFSLAHLNGPGRSEVAASHVHYYNMLGRTADAFQLLNNYVEQKIPVVGNLAIMKQQMLKVRKN